MAMCVNEVVPLSTNQHASYIAKLGTPTFSETKNRIPIMARLQFNICVCLAVCPTFTYTWTLSATRAACTQKSSSTTEQSLVRHSTTWRYKRYPTQPMSGGNNKQLTLSCPRRFSKFDLSERDAPPRPLRTRSLLKRTTNPKSKHKMVTRTPLPQGVQHPNLD